MKMQIEDAPTPPRTFAGQIPLPVEQAIMRALAKRPEARFQTAGELRTALISGAGIDAAPVSAVPVIQPPAPVPPQQTSDIAKETRVASAASTAGDQFQATQPAYQQNVAPDYGYQYQAAQPQAGFLSRLNWKHYAGAVVVLAAVIAVPVVILSSAGQKKDVVQQPAANQPRPTTSTQVEPSRSASPPTGSGTASVPSGEQPGAVTDPMKPKSIGELPVLPLPGETATANKQAKPAARKDDAAARAKAEKERKAAEARRLLNQ